MSTTIPDKAEQGPLSIQRKVSPALPSSRPVGTGGREAFAGKVLEQKDDGRSVIAGRPTNGIADADHRAPISHSVRADERCRVLVLSSKAPINSRQLSGQRQDRILVPG
jgi:hypothetical protein